MSKKRNNQLPMERILVITVNGLPNAASSPATLFATANTIGLSTGQLGIVSWTQSEAATRQHGTYITDGDTATNVPEIKLIQGTANSTNLSNTSLYNLGDTGGIYSGTIKAGQIRSVTTRACATPVANIWLIEMSTPSCEERYDLTVHYDSTRSRRDRGYNQPMDVYSVEIPNCDAGSPADPKSYLIEEFIKKYGGNLAAQENYVALAIKKDGTVISGQTISGIAAGSSYNFMAGKTFTATSAMVAGITAAIAADASITNAEIYNVPLTGNGAAASADAILIIGKQELPLSQSTPTGALYSELLANQVKILQGTGVSREILTNAAELSKKSDGFGQGTKWEQKFREMPSRNMGLLHGDPALPYSSPLPKSYIDTAACYMSVTIEYWEIEETQSGPERTDKLVHILIDGTNSTLKTNINAKLGAWLNSAHTAFGPFDWLGSATPSTLLP